MTPASIPHDLLAAKLGKRQALDRDDKAALQALPLVTRHIPARAYLIREGERPAQCGLVVSGFAVRHKIAQGGGRQIVALLVPGDFTDLQQVMLRRADHNLQALAAMEVVDLACDDLKELALSRPAIGRALWIDTLVETSIAREMLLNNGRRSAFARLAHMLCELEVRLGAAGLANRGYELPLTQEQLGDATGLTPVHVNRTLKELARAGLIEQSKRFVRIVDWDGLQEQGEFSLGYLHLDRGNAAFPGKAAQHWKAGATAGQA